MFSEKCKHWILPPAIHELLRDGKKYVQSFRSDERIKKSILDENRKFKNIHRGQRCFILACGPSINKQDLKLLKGEICISMSSFYLHQDYKFIDPIYHALSASDQMIPEKYWTDLCESLSKNCANKIMFFALSDRETLLRYLWHETHFLDFTGSILEMQTNGIDLCKPTPGPATASVMPLMIAVYMGFSEIYLLGFDHDWVTHLGITTDFYSQDKHVINRHYDPAKIDLDDLEPQWGMLAGLWKQYKAIRTVAYRMGIKIFNTTQGGLLDVFPRVRYESIFYGTPKNQ